jgi:hypothetical protein
MVILPFVGFGSLGLDIHEGRGQICPSARGAITSDSFFDSKMNIAPHSFRSLVFLPSLRHENPLDETIWNRVRRIIE